jgi:hypothetical protein
MEVGIMATKKCKAQKVQQGGAAEQEVNLALRPEDIEAVSDRLNDAGFALLAIRKLAIDVGEGDDDGFYAVAIQELARSTIKGIDACIERLTGKPGLGNFGTEFDRG